MGRTKQSLDILLSENTVGDDPRLILEYYDVRSSILALGIGGINRDSPNSVRVKGQVSLQGSDSKHEQMSSTGMYGHSATLPQR